MTHGAGEHKPHLWRWQVVVPAAAVILAAVIAPLLTSILGGESKAEPPSSAPRNNTIPPPTSVPPTTMLTTQPSTTGVLLGRELQPTSTETCRSRGVGEGSAWHVVTARVGDRSFENAYVCSLFSGGTGSLDFVLGNGYRELRLRIGFAADSGSVRHAVLFEVIGDDGKYLAEPKTLRFGETSDLVIDLMGRSRLKLRITETINAGGSEAPSKPAWAGGVLTPA